MSKLAFDKRDVVVRCATKWKTETAEAGPSERKERYVVSCWNGIETRNAEMKDFHLN